MSEEDRTVTLDRLVFPLSEGREAPEHGAVDGSIAHARARARRGLSKVPSGESSAASAEDHGAEALIVMEQPSAVSARAHRGSLGERRLDWCRGRLSLRLARRVAPTQLHAVNGMNAITRTLLTTTFVLGRAVASSAEPLPTQDRGAPAAAVGADALIPVLWLEPAGERGRATPPAYRRSPRRSTTEAHRAPGGQRGHPLHAASLARGPGDTPPPTTTCHTSQSCRPGRPRQKDTTCRQTRGIEDHPDVPTSCSNSTRRAEQHADSRGRAPPAHDRHGGRRARPGRRPALHLRRHRSTHPRSEDTRSTSRPCRRTTAGKAEMRACYHAWPPIRPEEQPASRSYTYRSARPDPRSRTDLGALQDSSRFLAGLCRRLYPSDYLRYPLDRHATIVLSRDAMVASRASRRRRSSGRWSASRTERREERRRPTTAGRPCSRRTMMLRPCGAAAAGGLQTDLVDLVSVVGAPGFPRAHGSRSRASSA